MTPSPSCLRALPSSRRASVLCLAALLAAPLPAAAQDGNAPAGGGTGPGTAPADGGNTAAPASGTAASEGGGAAGGSTGGATAGPAAHEGASGTAPPAGHDHAAAPPHSPPRGEGVGEAPDPPCTDAPVFDPSTPRFELQAGGGGGVFFLTWRQAADSFMAQPMDAPAEGLYSGGLVRGEAAFAFGGVSLSVIYTHLFLNRDGGAPAGLRGSTELGLLSGEIGVQCACRGSMYVWSFGIEIGGDVINGPRTTVFASIEHRSMFYLWEGLFAGFDVDIATFIGMSMNGPSGGGILGSVFLGYSFG